MRVFNRRIAALAVVICALVLYAVAETVYAVRGNAWHRLESRLDRLDDRLDVAESACSAAGDEAFVERLADVTERASDKVSAVVGALAKVSAR
jgi:hypothetical protein